MVEIETDEMSTNAYVIYWKDTNGKIYHGSSAISYTVASEWILFLNETYPYLKHWIERVQV
jgi:hypothetical protein